MPEIVFGNKTTREKFGMDDHQKGVHHKGGKVARKEGHDQLIHILANGRSPAIAHLAMASSGEVLTGVLKESDRFTITILTERAPKGESVFKHSIESFWFTHGNG